ncbi:hypothetical protein ABFX02_07G074250 [Erythranthe guttata]
MAPRIIMFESLRLLLYQFSCISSYVSILFGRYARTMFPRMKTSIALILILTVFVLFVSLMVIFFIINLSFIHFFLIFFRLKNMLFDIQYVVYQYMENIFS